MTTDTLSDKWRGQVAAPIDPKTVRFTLAQASQHLECHGCIFKGQHSSICREASAIAKADGLEDCDIPLPNGESAIYVLDKSDPRQIPIIAERL